MIEIPARHRDAVVAHAREGAPEEVCGVLGGSFDPDGPSRVESVHRAANAAALPRTEYEIDPEEAYRTFERVSAAGGEVVGFYHSHPGGPPGPSATDAARAHWPDRSYVIVVLDGDGTGGSDDGGDDRTAGSDGGGESTAESDGDGRTGSDGDDRRSEDRAGDGEVTVGSWRWTGETFERERVRIPDGEADRR